MFARHFIDSLDFARKGEEVRGEIPLAEMPRLKDVLFSSDGTISYVVRGSVGGDGKPMLNMMLDGSCYLRCQRCMEALLHPVKLGNTLLVVSENELDEFSGEEGEPDCIAADAHLEVAKLVEDELLLSLPFAPKHPEGVCRLAVGSRDDTSQHPFAALSELKVK